MEEKNTRSKNQSEEGNYRDNSEDSVQSYKTYDEKSCILHSKEKCLF